VQAGMSKEWAAVLVTLTLRNGEQIVLTEFDRMHAFVATLLDETARRLLPDIRARIGAGETVVFGEFAISSEGWGYRAQTLPWKKVTKLRVENGGIWVHKKGQKQWFWCEAISKVSNHHVFLVIANELRTASRTLESKEPDIDTDGGEE